MQACSFLSCIARSWQYAGHARQLDGLKVLCPSASRPVWTGCTSTFWVVRRPLRRPSGPFPFFLGKVDVCRVTRNMSPATAFPLFTQQRFQRPLFNKRGFQGRPELFKGISACHTDVCRGPAQRFPRDSTGRFFPFSPSRSGPHGPCLLANLSSPTPTHIRIPLARGSREVDFQLARVIANLQQSCTPCHRDSGIHLDGLIGASRISKFSNEWSETFSRSMMPGVATHSMRL